MRPGWMTRALRVGVIGCGLALLPGYTPASGQSYPVKPIRIIVPNAPGGIDTNFRIIMPRLQELLGQPIVIESRPGASGALGAEAVARAEPDGYTLLYCTSAQIVTSPLLKKGLRYDPIRDFTPITKLFQPIEAIQVTAEIPAKTIPDLIAHAKAHPGKLTYASSGVGSVPHFNGELFKTAAGIDLLHVPYNGVAQIVPELLAGRIDVAFLTIGTAQSLLDTGKVRMLAGLDPERTGDMPSILETLPGFRRAPIWFGLFGPAGLPREIVDRLHAALSQSVKEQAVRAALDKAWLRIVVSTPAELATSIQADRALTQEIINKVGLTPE